MSPLNLSWGMNWEKPEKRSGSSLKSSCIVWLISRSSVVVVGWLVDSWCRDCSSVSKKILYAGSVHRSFTLVTKSVAILSSGVVVGPLLAPAPAAAVAEDAGADDADADADAATASSSSGWGGMSVSDTSMSLASAGSNQPRRTYWLSTNCIRGAGGRDRAPERAAAAAAAAPSAVGEEGAAAVSVVHTLNSAATEAWSSAVKRGWVRGLQRQSDSASKLSSTVRQRALCLHVCVCVYASACARVCASVTQ